MDADKSESIPPLAFLINLGNIKCLKLNCACTKQKVERGRLPSLSPYDNETTRFIIPISTNWWIVSRLESFKLSSFPASYPYHAIEIISHPSFQRIRRRKKGNDSFWDGGFRITFPLSLSFFRSWSSLSSPPPHFCADQTQRHSDLKKREGRVARPT